MKLPSIVETLTVGDFLNIQFCVVLELITASWFYF